MSKPNPSAVSRKLTHIFRTMTGQSIIALGMVFSFFVLTILGLFSFEVNRVELANEQLRSASDAAALSAAATLASSDNFNTLSAQTTAMNTALTTFQQNSVLGVSLANAVISATATDSPTAGNSSIFVQFLDPHNNNQPVALGDPKGKVVSVTSAYGVKPTFANILGLSNPPLHSTGTSGVPSLDVVLCFDVSASIDDQTEVSFVRRELVAGKNVYIIPPTAAGSPAGALAEGKIYDILGPQPTGSSVDGLAPQNLSASNTPGANRWPLNFSENAGYSGAVAGLRGLSNTGSPPGVCPIGNAYLHTFTDLVVNIDGNQVFGGITSNGFAFPDIATVVEAARGNLENNVVFVSSNAVNGVPVGIAPKAGYLAEYLRLAQTNIHPLGDAQIAGQQFLSIINTNTDAHFSLVAFTSNAGTSATSTYTGWNVDATYPAANFSKFPVPLIPLDPTIANTNYSQSYNALPTTFATSGTNIGDAIRQAVNQLTVNSRRGSKKAIVLFTDGEPTSGGPLNNDPWTNARKAAVLANNAGIPIYVIGLAQNPEIIPSETAILNDTNSDPSTGGVAGIAGNGGKFFLITNTQDLRFTFENIARQLVQLVN